MTETRSGFRKHRSLLVVTTTEAFAEAGCGHPGFRRRDELWRAETTWRKPAWMRAAMCCRPLHDSEGETAMRAVIQRVTRAVVRVDGDAVGAIAGGLLVLLSVGKDDTTADEGVMIGKIAGLRVFTDDEGRMNLDVGQVGGDILLVSQFTLHGDVRKGKRPSFMAAMAPESAREAVDAVGTGLRALGLSVAEGQFGADMQIELVNDGPVTILIDTKRAF